MGRGLFCPLPFIVWLVAWRFNVFINGEGEDEKKGTGKRNEEKKDVLHKKGEKEEKSRGG